MYLPSLAFRTLALFPRTPPSLSFLHLYNTPLTPSLSITPIHNLVTITTHHSNPTPFLPFCSRTNSRTSSSLAKNGTIGTRQLGWVRGLLPIHDCEVGCRRVYRGTLQRVSFADGLREGTHHVWELEEEQFSAGVEWHGRWRDCFNADGRWSWWRWSSESNGVLHSHV